MLQRLFLHHPRAVGESYGEHLRVALGFGMAMIVAGLACLLHALIPALCKTSGSDAIRRLHERMVDGRRARAHD